MENEDFYNQKAMELWGIKSVLPYQRLVMHHLLSVQGFWGEEQKKECNRENLVIFPTGMGKSLCFMLPGVLLDEITVVVYPLISLMEDQYRRMDEKGIKAAVLKGGMSPHEKLILKEKCLNKEINFLLTNPEMCGTSLFKDLSEKGIFSQIIIDEVHTLLHWGKTFRPAMVEMKEVIAKGIFKGIHYFTATLSPEEESELHRLIRPDNPWNCIRSPGDRPNLSCHFILRPEVDAAMAEIVADQKQSILIFCRTRLGCEETCRELRFRLKDRHIHYYHAGLQEQDKRKLELWFLNSENGIMVATKAYGMGVDKSDISLVIHRDFPDDPSSYLQEAGRGGRNGKKADSVVFLPWTKHNITGSMKNLIDSNGCRRAALYKIMGEELDQCGGCDYCTPRNWTPRLDTTRANLYGSLRRVSAMMSLQVMVDFFRGLNTPQIYRKRLYLIKSFGSLNRWEREDIENSLRYLIQRGLIHKMRLPGMKGILLVKAQIKNWNKSGLSFKYL